MSNVLFLLDIALRDPKRGTPQHVCEMLRQIRTHHSLTICAKSVPDDLSDIFVPYPKERGLAKLRVLRSLVEQKEISHVFTISQTGLLAPVLLKYLCGVTISDELHGLDFEEFYADKKIGYGKYLLMKWKVWLLLHFYDTVFVMSSRLRDRYLPMSRNWVLVWGGVDVSVVPDASAQPRDTESFVVGYMGNARAYQGLPYLIEAVDALRKDDMPIRLNLIISGDDTELMRDLRERELLELTNIHRNVSHDEAFRLIGRSDVLVIPRPNNPITEYAFPGKLAEYLATGIPSIATQIGPIDEMQDEFKEVALLVGADAITANVADALKKVYRMSTDERRALGQKARAIAQKFNWEDRGKLFSEHFN